MQLKYKTFFINENTNSNGKKLFWVSVDGQVSPSSTSHVEFAKKLLKLRRAIDPNFIPPDDTILEKMFGMKFAKVTIDDGAIYIQTDFIQKIPELSPKQKDSINKLMADNNIDSNNIFNVFGKNIQLNEANMGGTIGNTPTKLDASTIPTHQGINPTDILIHSADEIEPDNDKIASNGYVLQSFLKKFYDIPSDINLSNIGNN